MHAVAQVRAALFFELGLLDFDDGGFGFRVFDLATTLLKNLAEPDYPALAEDASLRALAGRVEVSGETVFFYTQDAQPLLQALAAHPQLRTLHRPANLEDLFLKLTGRQIREDG